MSRTIICAVANPSGASHHLPCVAGEVLGYARHMFARAYSCKVGRMKKKTPAAADVSAAPEIRPGQSIELLKALHILTVDGKMNQDSRRKLKQVYHLVQFIEPLLAQVLAERGGVSERPKSVGEPDRPGPRDTVRDEARHPLPSRRDARANTPHVDDLGAGVGQVGRVGRHG